MSQQKSVLITGCALLLLGSLSLILSILLEHTILAFIGLSLTFWGILFLFIRPVRYVKSSLLNSATLSTLTTINQMITQSNPKGKAVHLPPRRLEEVKGGKAFISSEEEIVIPSAEEEGEELFHKSPKGILLTPPGIHLTNLFEDTLGTNFTKLNLDQLKNSLPKLFIEDLEIAEDLTIHAKADRVYAKVTGSIYQDLCKEARKLSSICVSIGCPLCSSIACALARTTGKPVMTEKCKPSEDGKTIEAHYRIIRE